MSNTALATRKARLESTLSQIAGCEVELTIRGERAFTLSSEGNREAELQQAQAFFGELVDSSFEFDAEIDFSCLYFSVK